MTKNASPSAQFFASNNHPYAPLPPRRGRYYPRHRARVIEQGDLFVIEFVPPSPRKASAPLGPPAAALFALCGGVSASAVVIAHLLHLV